MRKHLGLLIITSLFALVASSCNGSNGKEKLSFKESEYQIHSGDSVTVKQKLSGISYSFAGQVPANVRLDSTNGTIYFDASVPN